VSSQLDTERADLARERSELKADPAAEVEELTTIYERRGLSPDLARRVAVELSAHDGLSIHARDELGIDVEALARPAQASIVSALSFIAGALLPVVIVALTPGSARIVVTIVATLVGLVLLGVTGAGLGGAPRGRAAVRVFIGGVLALAIALGIGQLTGAAL
jgi:VIT1/CCC1 family predicted Fe2+/Mn2+ transporter